MKQIPGNDSHFKLNHTLKMSMGQPPLPHHPPSSNILVVLGVVSTSNVPQGKGDVVVRGELGGEWLACQGQAQQLVWQVTTAQLEECVRKEVVIRVQLWREFEMLGHLEIPPQHCSQHQAL